MKSLKTVVALVVVFAGTALAAGATDAKVAKLQEAKAKVAAAANNTKGYPRARLDQERVRLQGLIDDLDQGRRVSTSDIDSAIERANQAR